MDKNWLRTYTNTLNKFGSSLEDIKNIFAKKDKNGLNRLLKAVVDNLVAADLQRARESASYEYYVAPFITQRTPEYSNSTWPIHLKRLNAALRNKSQWLSLSRNKKIELYKYET